MTGGLERCFMSIPSQAASSGFPTRCSNDPDAEDRFINAWLIEGLHGGNRLGQMLRFIGHEEPPEVDHP